MAFLLRCTRSKMTSYLVIGADVNRENLDLTFEEIAKEIKRLRTEKIDEEELDIARNHFIGGLQLEITTSFAHADKIKSIVLYNLPHSYYQKMISTDRRHYVGRSDAYCQSIFCRRQLRSSSGRIIIRPARCVQPFIAGRIPHIII